MQNALIAKARHGRNDALVALDQIRSDETPFDKVLRKSKRRGWHRTASDFSVFGQSFEEMRNDFARAA